jgi:tripartite-type tricarboxylate transporter receptor subunit TctC
MVGFGPGGGTDVVTRIIMEPLSELLGQRFVVENKTGAGGVLAADMVAKSEKDGYTALMISAGHTVSAATIKAQLYDAVKDFAPAALVANSAFVIVVPKDSPAKTLKDLIDMAKKEPGKLNGATVGVGSTQHLANEMFLQSAGIDVKHVPYRTTPEVVTALRRNEVTYGFDLAHAIAGQVQSGDLRVLAVTTAKRWPTLPDVPTMMESGIAGYEVLGWYGLVFPAGTPAAVVDKTNKGLKEVLSREAVRNQLQKVGAFANVSTPQEFNKLIESEVTRWRAVAKKAGIEPK